MLNDDDSNIFDDDARWTEAIVSNRRVWPHVTEEGYRGKGVALREDTIAWLEEHVGPRSNMRQIGVWRSTIPLGKTLETCFYFKDADKAVLFKLTWG